MISTNEWEEISAELAAQKRLRPTWPVGFKARWVKAGEDEIKDGILRMEDGYKFQILVGTHRWEDVTTKEYREVWPK